MRIFFLAAALLFIAATGWFVFGRISETVEISVESYARDSLDSSGAQYAAVEFDPSSQTLMIDGFLLEDLPESEAILSIDKIELIEADIVGLQSIFDKEADAKAGDFFDAFRIVQIEGLAVVDPLEELTVRRITIEDLALQPLAPLLAGKAVEGVDDHDFEQVAAAFLLAARAAYVELDSLESKERDDIDAQTRVGQIAIEKYDGGRMERATLRALRAKPGLYDQVSIAEADMQGLDVSADLKQFISYAEEGEDSLPLTTIDMLVGRDIEIDQAGVATSLHVDEFEMGPVPLTGELPLDFGFELRGLEMPVADMESVMARQTLLRLGYLELQVNLSWRTAYDQQTRRLVIERFAAGASDLGTISLQAVLADVNLSEMTIAEVERIAERVQLVEASLHYDDASLVSRLLAAEAKSQGLTREQILAELGGEINGLSERFAAFPSAQAIKSQLLAFIEQPGSLTVRLRPDSPAALTPLMMGVLVAPELGLATLNMEVAANGPEPVAIQDRPPEQRPF